MGEAVSCPLCCCSVAVSRRRREVPSVWGGALLEQGLGFCLGTVRLQQLNKAWGKKKEKACQVDFPVS